MASVSSTPNLGSTQEAAIMGELITGINSRTILGKPVPQIEQSTDGNIILSESKKVVSDVALAAIVTGVKALAKQQQEIEKLKADLKENSTLLIKEAQDLESQSKILTGNLLLQTAHIKNLERTLLNKNRSLSELTQDKEQLQLKLQELETVNVKLQKENIKPVVIESTTQTEELREKSSTGSQTEELREKSSTGSQTEEIEQTSALSNLFTQQTTISILKETVAHLQRENTALRSYIERLGNDSHALVTTTSSPNTFSNRTTSSVIIEELDSEEGNIVPVIHTNKTQAKTCSTNAKIAIVFGAIGILALVGYATQCPPR